MKKEKPVTKGNLILGLISVILALYMVEIFLYLWEPTPWRRDNTREKAAKKAGISYDIRTKWQVVQDLRRNGVDAYPAVFPHYFLPNGLMTEKNAIVNLSGISMKTTVLCNESGEWITYVADEYGFNNPPGSWGEKETDIMLIGDSFVHGGCVKPGEDLGGQLRKYGWKVINVAMGGNGPLMELASLKEYAEPIKPKNVLWVYYEDNDFVDFQREKRSDLLRRYLENDFSQNLIHRQPEVDKALRHYIERELKTNVPKHDIFVIIRLKHLMEKFKHLKRVLVKKEYTFPPPEPLFGEVLKSARDRVNAWGGRLYFVYLPQWSRYVKKVDHDQWRNRKEVLSIVQELNVPIIDLHQEVFLNHPDPLSLVPLRLYGHYNAEAYKLIAAAIDRHLRSQQSISDINFN